MEDFAGVFADFEKVKNIDRPTMVRVLDDVFRTLIRRKYGSDENFDVIVNATTGDLEIWRFRQVVPDGEVTDENTQVSESEARQIDKDLKAGDECFERMSIQDFGRRSVTAACQTLVSRILELEKDEIFRRYSEMIGELVTGEISQVLKREFLVIDDNTGRELVLPRTEMIKGDHYRKGDLVRGVIRRVEMRNSAPYIVISRTDPVFLQRLLEKEVPEIEDGLIEIKNVVRLPGERAKVAVESHDDRIDPVGACVGMRGGRIHGIVRELRSESIDIINYTSNIPLYIQRSLTPAKVSRIEVDTEKKHANVYLEPDQVSLAIGKGGSNIKLASRLTGYEIDVYRNTQQEYEIDDVELEEFADEIEPWVIEAFKKIGCDTARQVLELSSEEIARRTDLEEETVKEVMAILAREFESE